MKLKTLTKSLIIHKILLFYRMRKRLLSYISQCYLFAGSS